MIFSEDGFFPKLEEVEYSKLHNSYDVYYYENKCFTGKSIDKFGTKRFFLKGLLHREYGPAVIGHNGYTEYWVEGNHLTFEEFIKKFNYTKYSELNEIGIENNSKFLVKYNKKLFTGKMLGGCSSVSYYKDGVLHREDGPASINDDNGKQCYYKNDKLHREDGPAVIYPNGTKEYYINGKELTKDDLYKLKDDSKQICVHVIEYEDKSQTIFDDINEFLNYMKIDNSKKIHKMYTQTLSKKEYQSLPDMAM